MMSVALIVVMTAVFIVCGAVSASAVDSENLIPGGLLDDVYKYVKGYLKYHFVPLYKLETDAENGDPEAQCALGFIYLFGEEQPELYKRFKVRKDYKKAFTWFECAAKKKGHKDGEYFLGLMYHLGLWVQQDSSEAVKWYRKSANQKDAGAQATLGLMYYQGEGVKQDKTEGIKWLRKAAEQESVPAQFLLGMIYYCDDEVKQDKTEADKWCRKAAEQGFGIQITSEHIVFNLEKILEKIPQPFHPIYTELLRIRAQHGDTDAQEALTQLGETW